MYVRGNSLSSLSLVSSSLGGLPYSVEHIHVEGEGHVRLKLGTPIYMYTEYAQFIDVSEVDNGGVQ